MREKAVAFLKKFSQKLNIIDYILIAVLLFSLLGITVKIVQNRSGADSVTCSMVFACEYAPAEILAHIQTGAVCTDASYNTPLGTVVSLQKGEDGNSLRLTVRVKAADTEHGMVIRNVAYLIGQRLTLNAGEVQIPVYIADIHAEMEE